MTSPDKKSNQDDALYVSPTSNDTVAERYKKVQEQDAQMSMEERVKRLREAPSIFEFDADSAKVEEEL